MKESISVRTSDETGRRDKRWSPKPEAPCGSVGYRDENAGTEFKGMG